MSLVTQYIFIFNVLTFCCIITLFLLQRNLSRTPPSPYAPRKNAHIWRWTCVRGFCRKSRITPETENISLSLSSCRLFCLDYAGIWPQPTGQFQIGHHLVRINVKGVEITTRQKLTPASQLLERAANHFKESVMNLVPKLNNVFGRPMIITVDFKEPNIDKLALDTNEGYRLFVQLLNGIINVTITADNFFGGRHGLETLTQLVVYDDVQEEAYVIKDVYITDKPVYPYRGVLLDTARSYISVGTIKRTIKAMAASKLNTFHWHITDSQSFPYLSKSYPALCQLGAYSPSKIYTRKDIAGIVQFGKERGVRVMPEFDAPAHVGEGWQDTNFVVCFNNQPWNDYCYEPPCGQLDPTKPELYDLLEGIYKDMIEQFGSDLFHMGGDEISLSCWNSTKHIVNWMSGKKNWGREEDDFVELWNYFQSHARERFLKHAGNNTRVIVWSSKLTEQKYVAKYLPKDNYIIQVWAKSWHEEIANLLEANYTLILSNYDQLYLDCGFSGWLNDGNNWCSPFIGWQKIYEHNPAVIAGARRGQILGSEAALWTEQVGDCSVDVKLWPRASALAERLWSDPSATWKEASDRLVVHRERLVRMGVAADAVEPEWCRKQKGGCLREDKFNTPN